jgi:hypothetical protein
MADELLHEQVVLELSRGERRLGLWAKALSDSLGDEQKAKALYIRYRVRSLIDELEAVRASNSKSTTESTVTANSPPDAAPKPGNAPLQLPADSTTLVDMLAEALDDQRHQQASELIDRLRLNGFDNDSIELLVEDRLGPNGVQMLWRQPSFTRR